MVPVGAITPNPFQPRSLIEPESLRSLADSIRRTGLMQPIIVRRRIPAPGTRGSGGGEDYELVAGERRWRAAGMVGLERIPALVRALSDEDSAEWALVENLQREDLNPIDRAGAFRVLGERLGWSHARIADRVGLDRSSVANLLRLMELEEPIRAMVAEGRLSAGHGKALLGAPSGEGRIALAGQAADEEWSVRRLERAAQEAADARTPRPPGPRASPAPERPRGVHLGDLERQLGEHLGTKVKINAGRTGAKGRLTIEFYGLDHFDGLMSKLGFEMR